MVEHRLVGGGAMSRIVIDVGCASYGGDSSIPYLIDEFHPDVLIGLDPNLTGQEPSTVPGMWIQLRPAVAWTYDGTIGFTINGTSGHVGGATDVECVDLARLILEQPAGSEVILKLDCEAAEYELLPHLVATDADLRLRLAWVERHCLNCSRGGGGHRTGCNDSSSLERYDEIASAMRCEMHSWNR
jgi:hypothetical protein